MTQEGGILVEKAPTITSVEQARSGDFLGAWETLQKGNDALAVSKDFGLRHSAWVRGHIRLPTRLLEADFSVSGQRKERSDKHSRILLQVAELGRKTGIGSTSVGTVLLVPPAGSPESEGYVSSYFVESEPLVPLVNPGGGSPMALDEYIDQAAERLLDLSTEFGTAGFRVDGPYWAVLPALFAAQKTGGTVEWDLTFEPERNLLGFRPSLTRVTDDPLAAASTFLANSLEVVHAPSRDGVPVRVLQMFSLSKIHVDGSYGQRRGHESTHSGAVPVGVSQNGLPLVSVVLPSYRSDGSVFATLRSLVEQTYPLSKLEVIVIANGPGKDNLSKLEDFATEYPAARWQLLKSEPGVSRARNIGMQNATGEFFTFVDDDDLVQENYIAALVAMSDSQSVVVTEMIDIQEDGSIAEDTNASRRVSAIGFDRPPAFVRAGLFGTAGAKLLPSELRELGQFDESLSSGEDVAFLGSLIADETLRVVASHRLSGRAYIRRISAASVSRPHSVTPIYGVRDRLRVIHSLWKSLRNQDSQSACRPISTVLVAPQISMLETSLERDPTFEKVLRCNLIEQDMDFLCYLQSSLRPEDENIARILQDVLL